MPYKKHETRQLQMNSRGVSGIMPYERHQRVTKGDTHLVEGREVCSTVLEDVLRLITEDLACKVV